MPEIRTFTLEKEDKFLVLASDGLFDWMKRRDITKAIPHFISLERKKLQENEKGKSDHELMTKEVLARGLMEVCVERAAKKENLTVDFFKKLAPGKEKRMLIDDLTVLVLDLEDQTK